MSKSPRKSRRASPLKKLLTEASVLEQRTDIWPSADEPFPSPDTKAPDGEHTYDEVVTALKKVKDTISKYVALWILNHVGRADSVRELEPARYDAVVKMCEYHFPKAPDPSAEAAKFDPYGGKPYLTTDYKARKELPIMTGFLDYFPLACLEVASVSAAGNAQHNPGEKLHWARGKSMDQVNTAVRHLMERGTRDIDGQYHVAKAIWRLLAGFQIQLEQERGLPPSRGCTADQRDDG